MSIGATSTFNRTDRVAEGWYWALRSADLPRGQVKPVELLGRHLAVYRGQDGRVAALDAHCPHMGAHLAEGKVDGNGLRCFFHNWKFESDGCASDVPCATGPVRASVRSWPVEERYGLIWLWTGETARHPVPYVPELEHDEGDALLGARFAKGCHPNVVMINAIDAHHFNTVHHLPVDLDFECIRTNENNMRFENRTRMPESNAFTRFAGRFYAGPLTYKMSYWYGSTGSVTVGPDFLHFHIIFALRLAKDGTTEGQTILVTKRRRGPIGWLFNRVLLFLSWVVGTYFAHGDTRVFQTIKFDFKTPLKADRSIIQFIKHVEEQPSIAVGAWTENELVQLPSIGLRAVEGQ